MSHEGRGCVAVYPPGLTGGLYYYSESLVTALRSSGVPIWPPIHAVGPDATLEHQVAPSALPPVIRKPMSALRQVRDLWRLERAVKRNQVDAVHFVWLPRLVGPSVLRRLRKKAPIILTVHNVLPHDSEGEQVVRAWGMRYSCADVLVCHTDETVTHLSRLYGPAIQDRCVVIPHPIGQPWWSYDQRTGQQAARESLGLPTDRRLVLYFGSLRPYKKPEFLLRCWQRVVQECPDATLVIAGQTHDDLPWDGIERLIDDLRIRDSVISRIGWIPSEQLPAFMAAADLAVLPYERIDASGVASTAAYWDLPMILSDVPGFRSVWLRHGATLVPLDIERWVRAIIAALDDLPDAARRAGVIGRSMRAECSWPAAATSHESAYDRARTEWPVTVEGAGHGS